MDDTARMLDLLNTSFPDLTVLSPHEARAAVDARIRPATNLDDVASTEDHTIDGAAHGIPVRVYHPHAVREGAPVTVYAHGGGFLHGSIESHDGFCRSWARHTAAPVISVEYRLAPDAEPPAARDDVVAAVDWARASGRASHGVIIAGDSSGGNLAAGAALVLRDRGDSPLVGQVLVYPFLDPAMSSESYRTRGEGYFVTAALLAYYWKVFLGDRGDAAPTAEVTPLAAQDLTGLPPAVVVTAGLDPLCDEGALYAQRLRDAGVPVVLRHAPDQFHGFLTIADYGPAQSVCEMLWHDVRRFTASPKESR